MATRSTIAIEREDGTVAQVYCHWDGYLDHNGRILLEHYQDPAKVEQLIAHGSISSLKPEIGEKHDFDWYFNKSEISEEMKQIYENRWTTFYHRDRGEDLEVTKFWNFDMYRTSAVFEEYDYIYRSGKWYVQVHGRGWSSLEKAFNADAALEDA